MPWKGNPGRTSFSRFNRGEPQPGEAHQGWNGLSQDWSLGTCKGKQQGIASWGLRRRSQKKASLSWSKGSGSSPRTLKALLLSYLGMGYSLTSFASYESCGSLRWGAALGFGFCTLPMKSGMPVSSSKIKKTKGRSRLKAETERDIATLVAADASTPSSLSSSVDWCCILDTKRGFSVIFWRFGFVNSSWRPTEKWDQVNLS